MGFKGRWTTGSEIEVYRAEYQSFMQEQWQLERSPTRSRPDLGDVLSFCSAQAGSHARQQLYKGCTVSNEVCCIPLVCVGFYCSWDYGVSGISINSTCDPRSCTSWREVLLSTLIVSPSGKKKCVVSCSACKILFRARTLHWGVFSRSPDWQCFLSPWPSPIASRQFQSMESRRDSMRRSSREWPAGLLGSGSLAPPHCQRYYWATVPKWHLCNSNSIKTRSANFGCSGSGACRVCASCFACTWSSWVQQNSFLPQRAEVKNLLEPHEEIEISSPPSTAQKLSLLENPCFASTLTAQASRGKSCGSGRDRIAAPVFRMGFP